MSHVGIVAVSHPGLGGTFQYTLSMIDALLRIPGNRYTIFTTAENHAYDNLGAAVERMPSFWPIVLSALGRRLNLSSRAGLFGGVDKIIAPIYTTRLLASRVPFVFTLHDVQEKHFPEYFSFAQRVWRHSTNWALTRTAAGIVCESSYVKADVNRFFGADNEKIFVLPAPPLAAFSAESQSPQALQATRSKLSLPDQFLFYPAQFFPHKNHRRLVEAFAQLARAYPDCHLVLTGQQRYEYERVMARAGELGVAGRVRHVGYIDTQALAGLYKLATLVVVPTLFESVSIPVYEAFMLGAPVCVSNVVALPEQVGDAGILFDPFSVDDMTRKISGALDNPQLRSELARRGKARIAAMTLDRYAAQLSALLEKIG
jgi:glycosyltransferase involved in cell wall biosynthesis